MPQIVASVFVAAVSAAPDRSYGQPQPTYGEPIICNDGQVLSLDGNCVTPKVHRQVYVFTPPHRPRVTLPRPSLPTPEVITNVVFIRVPEEEDSAEPIVVPPPQEKHVVYVLNKRKPAQAQRVIQVPAGPPSNPEVYFVHYKDGENPQLPGGLDLQTALSKAAHAGGRVIDGGDGFGGGLYGGDSSEGDDFGNDSFDDGFDGGFPGTLSPHYGAP